MLRLSVFLLAAWCCHAALKKCGALDGGDQYDLPSWDFQTERPQSNGELKPYNPVCSFDGIKVSVREGYEKDQGGWVCIVENRSDDDYVVRVQTTENDENPAKDNSWDFYYYVKARQQTLTNPGKAGASEVCRLCGAKKVVTTNQKWDDIEPLEQATYDFQCRRRCQAVLYQHRNFNGASMTIASNIADLKAFNLSPKDAKSNEKPKVSSLKIFGEGCELRLYEDIEYNKGNYKEPVCTFVAGKDAAASSWDMDALRKQCCGPKCPDGQDCFQSVAIRDIKRCGGGQYSNSNKPDGCGARGCLKSSRNDFTATATADRVVALERLFKAMAAVLEE